VLVGKLQAQALLAVKSSGNYVVIKGNKADANADFLRAGMVRKNAAGIYSYLPLAQRSLLKIQKIVRQEMDAIGGQEMYLPALNPAA
jgi:prolyl-tRNA synthetase